MSLKHKKKETIVFKILTKNYNNHHHSRDRENRKEKATFIGGEENKGKQENGLKGGGAKS